MLATYPNLLGIHWPAFMHNLVVVSQMNNWSTAICRCINRSRTENEWVKDEKLDPDFLETGEPESIGTTIYI